MHRSWDLLNFHIIERLDARCCHSQSNGLWRSISCLSYRISDARPSATTKANPLETWSDIICMNSSPTSDAYMRRWTGSALVKIMACRLVGAKPLYELMLEYCQLDPCEQTSVKFESRYKTFHPWKRIWKCRLRNGGHFIQRNMN